MARPNKNNCDYFPHDRDMRDHKKIKAVRSKFGISGYALWVMTLEYLTGSDGNVFQYSDTEFELMAGDFGVSATEIRDLIDYCIRLELLFNDNGFIKSESLDERLSPVYQKRGKAKELSKKQLRSNGKYVSSNTGRAVVSVAEMPQSKVKESKEEKSKEYNTYTSADCSKFWSVAFDEITIEQIKQSWSGVDIEDELKKFKAHAAINESYEGRDVSGMRSAFLYQLRKHSKINKNGTDHIRL